jgi:Tetrapyrrole (Corrin/Porphyrin) Methylases
VNSRNGAIPPQAVGVRDPFLSPRHGRRLLHDEPALPPPSGGNAFGTMNDNTEQVLSANEQNHEEAPLIDQSRNAGSRVGVGSLVVVGTGVMAVNQVTREAQYWIEQADKVLCFEVGPVTERWIRTLNVNVEPLDGLRSEGKSALQMGSEIVERTLDYVRSGLTVCAVYAGHPAVCGYASHQSIKTSRDGNYRAVMLPGVSIEDCLFSDLGIDPLHTGYHLHNSVDFVVRRKQPDTSSGLILRLVDSLKQDRPGADSPDLRCHPHLIECLSTFYGAEHEVVLYQPARFTVCDPVIRRCTLEHLANENITALSILYVPPKDSRAADLEMLQRPESLPGSSRQLSTDAGH